MEEEPLYFAFLLRLWKEKEAGGFIWRASLENPHTGEHKGFSGLKPLFYYLELRTNRKDDHIPEKES